MSFINGNGVLKSLDRTRNNTFGLTISFHAVETRLDTPDMRRKTRFEMNDVYEHRVPGLIYIPTNVPGKGFEDVYDEILNGCRCDSGSSCSSDCHLGGFDEFIGTPSIECNDLCTCDRIQCSRRIVQRGPISSLVIRSTIGKKNLGLFSETTVSKGTFICEYAGEVIGKEEAVLRWKSQLPGQSNYILALKEHVGDKTLTTIVDPTIMGNIGRYLNHSCDPNLVMIPVRTRTMIPHFALFAKRRISVDEELTFDYSGDDKKETETPSDTRCLCRTDRCRGFLPLHTNALN